MSSKKVKVGRLDQEDLEEKVWALGVAIDQLNSSLHYGTVSTLKQMKKDFKRLATLARTED